MENEQLQPLPEWLGENEMPNEHGYTLMMMMNNDRSCENVEMSRAEYLALKRHLARMRGFNVPATEADDAN